ncbi:MAG: hypothetical protein IJE68_00660 [Clostridia bacterium]|nr:hypothetical protein [Clostridia bacterium]
MNILRWRRKSKKKFKFKTILLFSFSLIMTTFAWFAYSKVLNTSLNIHISSWDMEYYINEVKQENPEDGISVGISTLYPAMPEQSVTIDIKNNGERTVDIDYFLQSISIAGVSYELVQEGQTPTSANYILLTQAYIETDTTTGVQTVKGTVTNNIKKFPFTIEIEHSALVEPYGTDALGNVTGGEGYLTVKVNWIGDNHDLDSEWGYTVGEYLNSPGAGSVISMTLTIDSYQVEEDYVQTITMPSTAETKPYLPTGFIRVAGTTLESGLVIKDSKGNEYVWVEVPKSATVYGAEGLNITSFGDAEYTAIETALKAYSVEYRVREDQPTTYNIIGLSPENYTATKNKMLKSIYQNGGFYIGRYETGILGSYRDYYSESTEEIPVIQANAYPYNYVTAFQAQSLAKSMDSGSYTSSLMFGLQWDLVMKYLETKGVFTSSEDMETKGLTLGNYYDNTYYVTNPKAKYSLGTGTTTWENRPYEKYNKEAVYLTTGGNTTFSHQNIYDLAGNLAEWTFNIAFSGSTPIGGNGGDYLDTANNLANYCGNYNASTGLKQVGFRVTIY